MAHVCAALILCTILVNTADFDDDSDVEVDKDMHESSQLEGSSENEGKLCSLNLDYVLVFRYQQGRIEHFALFCSDQSQQEICCEKKKKLDRSKMGKTIVHEIIIFPGSITNLC